MVGEQPPRRQGTPGLHMHAHSSGTVALHWRRFGGGSAAPPDAQWPWHGWGRAEPPLRLRYGPTGRGRGWPDSFQARRFLAFRHPILAKAPRWRAVYALWGPLRRSRACSGTVLTRAAQRFGRDGGGGRARGAAARRGSSGCPWLSLFIHFSQSIPAPTCACGWDRRSDSPAETPCDALHNHPTRSAVSVR